MTSNWLDRLNELVVPPTERLYSEGDWGVVEESLGLALPSDYKSLIKRYGQGRFSGAQDLSGIYIGSYLGPGPAAQRAVAFSQYFAALKNQRFDGYPENPGLLGFGSYADEDTLAWLTLGSPDQWSIVLHDVGTGMHEIKGMSTVEFIVSMLEGTCPLYGKVFKSGEMLGPHHFTPGS